MKMADAEKKGGFFARFRKSKTEDSPGKSPKASPAASKQSKSTADSSSPAKSASAAEFSTQNRNDTFESGNTGALIENLFKTMLDFGIAYLTMVDNTLKAFSENLNKNAEDRKAQ